MSIQVFDNCIERESDNSGRYESIIRIELSKRKKCDLELEKNESETEQVKLLRAYGGCLGVKSRRRTWLTAKSFG